MVLFFNILDNKCTVAALSSMLGSSDVPGSLHRVLDQVDVPVAQVEEGKGQREEDAGVLVDGAGAGQLWDLREGRALLEEDGQRRRLFDLAATHRVVPPLQAGLRAAVHLVGGGAGERTGDTGQELRALQETVPEKLDKSAARRRAAKLVSCSRLVLVSTSQD